MLLDNTWTHQTSNKVDAKLNIRFPTVTELVTIFLTFQKLVFCDHAPDNAWF